MARAIGRPPVIENSQVISIRLDGQEFSRLRDIAALETLTTGRHTTAHELIRNAIHFVYSDNERLRECFRRSREQKNKIYRRKLEALQK